MLEMKWLCSQGSKDPVGAIKVLFPWIRIWAAPLVCIDLVIPRNVRSSWLYWSLLPPSGYESCGQNLVVPTDSICFFFSIPVHLHTCSRLGFSQAHDLVTHGSASEVARPSDAVKTLMPKFCLPEPHSSLRTQSPEMSSGHLMSSGKQQNATAAMPRPPKQGLPLPFPTSLAKGQSFSCWTRAAARKSTWI